MDKSIAKVELHIRPPLSYEVSKEAGGLILKPEIFEGETLRGLLTRLVVETPAAFMNVYDPDKGEIFPPIVTVVNGSAMNRSESLERELTDGDQITWFLMYAGG